MYDEFHYKDKQYHGRRISIIAIPLLAKHMYIAAWHHKFNEP